MQRGEVAVASAFAAPSNQFEERETSQLAGMQQSWTNPPRSGVPPPSPPPDDQDRPQHYRHSSSLPGGAARRNTKQKKPKLPYSNSPCMQFMSGYGCSFGDRCRYSHDLRSIYPAYYEYTAYEDPPWPTKFAPPRHLQQNYPQRHALNPPTPDPTRLPSAFRKLPQRERAASFGNHSNPHENQSEDASVSSGGKLLFKDAVLRPSNMKLSESKHRKHSPTRSSESDDYGDENRHSNREMVTSETKRTEASLPRQHQRRKNIMRARKSASGEGVEDPVRSDSAEFCQIPNYLLNEVGEVDVARAAGYAKPQRQYYSNPADASQLPYPDYSAYAQYVAEEQFHSNLGKQVEAFVGFVDTKLASMETHQQQAIDSLQELVRSLWPDAAIDVYGSNYTRLALPASDIDCVLVARSLVGERPLMILQTLAAEVERQPWTKRLELLGSAKIPVLKMTYSLDPMQQDVLLDLTCGHSVGHTGLGARELIYSFQAEMPALRPLVLVLKSHLVKNDLNSAFTGGISSYVLVILVIRFLQACGDTHLKSFTTNYRKLRGGNRRRSYSENPSARDFPEEGLAYAAGASDAIYQPKWCYTFTRGGHVTWRTGIGSLLMLFLETYITFDYRRFGISIDHEGEFFLLPPEKVDSTQSSVVIPYVADPIKPGRSICNSFRMHEVVQSWVALYQNLASGSPVAVCVVSDFTP